jgi:hypothetical protein
MNVRAKFYVVWCVVKRDWKLLKPENWIGVETRTIGLAPSASGTRTLTSGSSASATWGRRRTYQKALELVEKFTDAELRDGALVWFGMEDDFATNGTRTIPKFASRITGLSPAGAAAGDRMMCPSCNDVGVFRVAYHDGSPADFALCLCAAGERMRITTNNGKPTTPQWEVWAFAHGVPLEHVAPMEDLLTDEELALEASRRRRRTRYLERRRCWRRGGRRSDDAAYLSQLRDAGIPMDGGRSGARQPLADHRAVRLVPGGDYAGDGAAG